MRTFAFNYIGSFGSRLPYVPIYAESSHSRVNIRNIEESHFNLRKIELLLNTANAYSCYVVCLLFYAIGKVVVSCLVCFRFYVLLQWLLND